MNGGIRQFFSWVGGVASGMTAKVAFVTTCASAILSALSAGLSALVAKALGFLSSVDAFVSGLTTNVGTVGGYLSGSSLWAALTYLLGLDVALKAFLVALPSLLLGIVGVLVAGAGAFFTVMLAVAAYVAVKRVVRLVTLGFGQV